MRRLSDPWIFVSHSSRDLSKVREVRNRLEDLGAQPILLFLKCVTDRDELDSLVKREIEARTFFLLCDSDNARASTWVDQEVAHVRSLPGKVVATINLAMDLDAQGIVIDRLVQSATVFLSYAAGDSDVVNPIRDLLLQHDFAVWTPETHIGPGMNYAEAIHDALTDAAEHGYVLAFVTERALASRLFMRELSIAMEARTKGGRVIPILVDAVQPTFLYLHYSTLLQSLDFTHHDPHRLLQDLLRIMQ